MSLSRNFRHLLQAMTAALIGAYALSADPAEAQGRRDFCDNYANEAVRAAEANERRNCGYEGPRWSSNRGAHFAWCLIAPGQAEREADARREQLQECRQDRREEKVGKRANCDTYAKIAVVQADANNKYDCGYRGGEWITEERPHFRWCMRSRRDYLADEIRYRAVELQKCFNKLGDYDDEGSDRDYRRRRF